jgi:hypothetical protein
LRQRNIFFPERHNITVVFLCKCREGEIRLNEEHSAFKFFKEMPEDIHP